MMCETLRLDPERALRPARAGYRKFFDELNDLAAGTIKYFPGNIQNRAHIYSIIRKGLSDVYFSERQLRQGF